MLAKSRCKEAGVPTRTMLQLLDSSEYLKGKNWHNTMREYHHSRSSAKLESVIGCIEHLW
jgi:hypothetical protein